MIGGEQLRGRFVVLDGPDGCGKSTQSARLEEWIASMGVEVTTYRDPGTTAIGEGIREILLDPVHDRMAANTEVLLYMAARAQLWHERIGPDLAAGVCVVMDRWISSTCAYQGVAGGFGMERVIRLGGDCLARVWPDATVVLDVGGETAAKRMNRTLDRMERKGAAYHARVREGFLELARNFPDRVRVVNAEGDVETVQAGVRETLAGMIGG